MKLDKDDVLAINVAVFSIVAIVHLVRYVLNTPVEIAGFSLPLWFSLAAVVFALFLVWQNWSLTDKSKKTCAKIVTLIIAIDFIGVIVFWYNNLYILGLTSKHYMAIAGIEVIIISYLVWYIRK